MSRLASRNPWFPFGTPDRAYALRVFCFAHAGGSAVVFRGWQDRLPPDIQVCAVQLPGRGTRMGEPSITRMDPLVDAVLHGIEPWLDCPFALFGHSMGAAVCFELAHAVRGRGVVPEFLVVSGRRAPMRPSRPHLHHLPHDQFVEQLKRLNGTPREALEEPELLEVIVPILRADFAVIETCAWSPRPPLACPIVAIGGTEDVEVSVEDLLAWKQLSATSFAMHLLPGDHFFINSAAAALTSILADSHAQQRPNSETAARPADLLRQA